MSRFPFLDAVQPFVGIVAGIQDIPVAPGTGELFIKGAALARLEPLFGDTRVRVYSELSDVVMGAGASNDRELAAVKAVAEALERYCSASVRESEVVVASAQELGDAAMDWHLFPRLGDSEYADPSCPLARFDPGAQMRWVRGYSATHRIPVYVPLALTHVFQVLSSAESYTYQVSTGVATHTDLATASVSAICEVVERDALALAWLGKLTLPRLAWDELPAEITRVRNSAGAEYKFFDATTDLGIPTIVCVQLLDGHPTMSQVLCSATSCSASEAAVKAMYETICCSTVLEEPPHVPECVAEFTDLIHGMTYMARPAQRANFAFLLESTQTTHVRDLGRDLPSAPAERLRLIIERLKIYGHDVVLVDLTTSELLEYGLHTVRAVIPTLMPLPYVYRARFLGHPRIFAYLSAKLGRAVSESELNRDPLPFA
jgi:ribosomal protein S12 methylthiotransferase accessory factor